MITKESTLRLPNDGRNINLLKTPEAVLEGIEQCELTIISLREQIIQHSHTRGAQWNHNVRLKLGLTEATLRRLNRIFADMEDERRRLLKRSEQQTVINYLQHNRPDVFTEVIRHLQLARQAA